MFKRIWLFLLTNIAIIAVITIVIAIAENVFWITISWYSTDYVSVFIYAIIIWFSGSFISLFLSKWMAKRSYWVQVVNINDYSNLDSKEKIVFDLVRDLAERNHITMPEVWFYESNEPNAFATWASKNSSLVAVSTWLLGIMNKDEIEWVIAHEMAHVLNWDMVTMTLLQWLINTFVVFISRILANLFDNVTDWKFWALWYFVVNLVLQICIWILASLITMWFSRHREYKADQWSAWYVGKDKMISALEALKKLQDMTWKDDSKFATMKISTKWRSGIMTLFSTHPDLDDRINALKNLNI